MTGGPCSRAVVVGSQDNRERNKFLSAPLQRIGYDVKVISGRHLSNALSLFIACLRDDGMTKPDVVFIPGDSRGVLWWALGRWPLKALVIMRFGGDPLETLRSSLSTARTFGQWSWLVRGFFRLQVKKALLCRADAFIGVTADVCRAIRASGADGSCAVIPQWIEPRERDESRDARKIEESGRLHLLTVTNLQYREKYEGVLTLLDYLDDYTQHYECDYVYTIAGGGCYKSPLEKRAASVSSRQLTVQVLGYVDDVDALYETADIFMYATFLDGLPNVILEAKTHSLPMIINDYQGISHLVKEGHHGFIIEGNDSFAMALRQLSWFPNLRGRMGENNRSDVVENYSLQRTTERMRKFLQRLSMR